MLSVDAPGTALAPPPRRFNLAAHVLAGGAATPDKVALSIIGPGGGDDWSFARLARAVGGIAGGLAALGLAPGDRVLLRLGNSVEFPLAFLGCIAAGLVPVPTSSQLTTPEIGPMAALIDPRLIVAGPAIALPDPLPCPVLSEAEVHDLAAHTPAEAVMGDPDRPAYAVFTSGTSGQPRAVLHAHRAIWARRMMSEGWYGLRPDDRVMHAGAFNWTYTLGTGLMDPWSRGATALIPAPGTRPADLPALMAEHEATIFAAAPGVFRQMLRAGLPPLPALRHGLSAGEKLAGTIRAGWEADTGTALHEAFGMSECSTFISGCPAQPAPEGTLGFAQPGRRVAVLGEDGAPVQRGAPGLLAIDAGDPGLMLGYLGAPEATAERYRGGWFVTGDNAAMAPGGAIRYLGRDDDMINAGGYRVSPIEVEAAMAAHPGVHEAACVEIAVSDSASVIGCFYVPESAALADDTLSAHAHARLAHYKCPRIFTAVDTLPRGANGKLQRAVLRDGGAGTP
ncbi:class I adenylate-forming enzyme family protein [Maritimibacter sp. HL-12]|uniref:class I adenylate-forming enzyme family protein n=1 Tax=Maritimibacter sp. HL-12 TaxID=1162418 RepID=UPI000A0F2CFC|nr:class I adenylate-forming enzyme family protein [Maritimibacter sp. HL-12]SMH56054.1 Acyl-coenzyme A synthetase/AMP-(fatty) acid ligase [Maritimibacter sp. HL-12]